MGTYFEGHSTKSSLYKARKEELKPIKSKQGKDGFWFVVNTDTHGAIILFEKVVRTVQSGSVDYGWKPMDESMHPYYFDCPESFLKLTKVLNTSWRDAVALYHQKMNAFKALKMHDVFHYAGSEYTVWSTFGKSALLAADTDGKRYRFPLDYATEITYA